MTRLLAALCVTAASLLTLSARADEPKPVLGDFAGEIRKPDGHIDIAANLEALKAMSANTYFYLIWHKASDWDDLPDFASAAEKEGIDVWVYLIPWSETPLVKKSWGFSEPYRTDYVRWAEEIGKLSLDHKNIVGYVIDDFYSNSLRRDRFTPAYVRKMVDAGKQINPRLKFYPLLYFQQPWADFMDRFGDVVDGVVAAYPLSRTQVGNALVYLNREAHGVTAMIDLPRTKTTRPGDKGSIWTDLKVTDPAKASLSFYWDDSDLSNNRGYHTPFVRVDGRLVWQADTAGVSGDRVVTLDLSRFVGHRGDTVRVEIGVFDQRGVARYPVTVRLDDIRLTGFDTPSEMVSEKLWSRRAAGPFSVNLSPASQATGAGRRLPMILMPAGEREQHEKRYIDEAGSPTNIANKVETGLNMAREGRVEGVVTYCLPKTPADPIFEAVAREYRRAAGALRATPRD